MVTSSCLQPNWRVSGVRLIIYNSHLLKKYSAFKDCHILNIRPSFTLSKNTQA